MNDRHLDIFSGIGGFSLASEWAGFRTVAFAELDPEASLVLAHHWPHVPNVRDIRATRWDRFRRSHGRPALLTGGVPCQPASLLGKRLGSADERWLWPDTLGIVRELRPLACVFENPPALLSLDDGRAFGGILGGLAALGYDCVWGSVFAAAVDAGHLRERICLVATDTASITQRGANNHCAGESSGWAPWQASTGPDDRETPPHPHDPRLEGHERDGRDLDQSRRFGADTARSTAEGRVCEVAANSSGVHVRESSEGEIQAGRDTIAGRYRDLRGRVNREDWWHEAYTGIPVLAHGIPTRLAEAAARCTGNSIVPQAFYPILKALFDHLNP